MKHLTKVLIAIILAVLTAGLIPAQALANTPDYISEIKIGMGKKSADALAGLEGYTVLKDGNNPIDLNKDAGVEQRGLANTGAKGNKTVYLGYKTTKNRKEAITDLALMNMNGGYSVKDYEYLMEQQMNSQIIPFADKFIAAIEEYRLNYDSKSRKNSQRAKYLHDVMNKLIDDDTGMPLGDLLLNKTKYELGDDAYNKLSDDEKKKHADIVTILAQANGNATLLMENLITRAADTNDNSWLERFSKTTYTDLVNSTGMSPTDAKKHLAKQYDDDAGIIFEMWEDFRSELLTYDSAKAIVDNYDEDAVNDAMEAFENMSDDDSESEKAKILAEFEKAQKAFSDYSKAYQTVIICDELSKIKYLDGTMLDFFLQDSSLINEDITQLYPMAASLSEGQKTGLDFISIKELVRISITSEEGYKDETLDELKTASVYDGVDRAIYEKGGVALTTEALRKKKAVCEQPEANSNLYRIMLYVTFGLGAAWAISSVVAVKLYMYAQKVDNLFANRSYEIFRAAFDSAWRNSRIANYLCTGIGIAAGIMTIITVAIDAKEMAEYYNVKFSPIPHYMIDEKDLISYNRKGEQVVLKNQAAYYKAVECNRTKNDEKYNAVGTLADMNGDIGAQWLALYAAKNETEDPIVADSLHVEVNSDNIPAGYKTGIHLFGSDSAFNLNAYPYVFKKDATKIQVYYKCDEAPDTASNFTTGTLAIAGGGGVIIGAAITALGVTASKKKRENKTVTV